MKGIHIKFQVLFFVLCLLSLGVRAQNPRYIYIQTAKNEPFYVKIDDRLLNSTSTGYIIIAKLAEVDHHLSIGFPDNAWPELKVTVRVKDANTGYLLKRTLDKGWAMFNLLTMKSLAVETKLPPTKEVETVVSTDEFARILAEVVNDPSIARVSIDKRPAENPVKSSDDITVKTSVVQEEIRPIPVNLKTNDPVTGKTEVDKLRQDSTSDGLLIAYLDHADTVKIFLPVSKTDMVKALPDTVVKKDDLIITEKKSVANTGTAVPKLNANCKRSATQNDFLKLRKTMAAEDSEKNMTKAAIKQFLSTCYTTEQVKNLGILFITDEGRYKFFVAAYQHISDAGNSSALEDQLSDDYYKTRFKAMLSH